MNGSSFNRNGSATANGLAIQQTPSTAAGGGAGASNLRPLSDSGDVLMQRMAPRPSSEILAMHHPPTAQQEAIDRYYQEIEHAEMVLGEMAHAKLDNAFKEELRAIEEWYKVLSEVERTTALYSLFQYISPVQVRFFITVLNSMSRRADPANALFSSLSSEKGDSRPSSFFVDSDMSNHALNSDMLYNKLSSLPSPRLAKSMYTSQLAPSQRRMIDRLSYNEFDMSMKHLNLNDLKYRNGHNRPASFGENELSIVIHPNDEWSPLIGSGRMPVTPTTPKIRTGSLQKSPLPLESLSPRIDSMNHNNLLSGHNTNNGYLSTGGSYSRSKLTLSRSSSPTSHNGHLSAIPSLAHLRPSSPLPISPPSRSSSPAQLSNPAALATGAYYHPQHSNASPSLDGKFSRSTTNFGISHDETMDRNKPLETIDFKLLEDTSAWLRSLRLHKYTPIFEGLSWRKVIELTDEDLTTLGVNAIGARTKFLKVFARAKIEAQEQGLL